MFGSCVWVTKKRPPNSFGTGHLQVKETHNEGDILKSVAWGSLGPPSSLGSLDSFTSAQVSVEQNDVWIYVDGVFLLLELGKPSLLKDFLNCVDIAFNSGVGYVHRLDGDNLGLLDGDAFFDGLWVSENLMEIFEVVWSRFGEVT